MVRQVLFAWVFTLSLLAAGVSAGLAQEGTIVFVGYAEHPTLGPILTDTAGITLYTWDGDVQSQEPAIATTLCAGAWPPMLVDEISARWIMGMQGTPFRAIVRTDMTYQLTYEGWPLYSFVRDMVPGDVNGDGLLAFGGRWSIVRIDPTTPSSGSGQ